MGKGEIHELWPEAALDLTPGSATYCVTLGKLLKLTEL